MASLDMWKGFIKSFRAHVPGIVLIFDKFHILRHLSEALNKVRKQEFVKARAGSGVCSAARSSSCSLGKPTFGARPEKRLTIY